MNYNFDEIINRTGTASLKYEKYKNTDIIPMWVADMDFKAPPPVLKTLHITGKFEKNGSYGFPVLSAH
jgi:cystathionine beta-lyase